MEAMICRASYSKVELVTTHFLKIHLIFGYGIFTLQKQIGI